jgi:Clathrin adaptor complex small chain
MQESQMLRMLLTSLFLAAVEITMFDDVIVVYKFFGDLMFYVTGSQDENELILYTVLQAFYESISLLLRCRCQLACLACAPVARHLLRLSQ